MQLTMTTRLFERAANFVGLDFMAHPFWDKYLEYEERQDAHDRVYAILCRIIHIPMHQYARYFERLRTLAQSRPLEELASAADLARYRTEVDAELATYGVPTTEVDVERGIRAKVDVAMLAIFQVTQTETTKRWTFESELKRPYFHVTELDNAQLTSWRKYLDFEEKEGSYERIVFLYERCLVTCALYDEFWFRYVRWMESTGDHSEETRNIYLRATTLFVPVSRPGIRLQFAYFEESCKRVDVARAIHEAVLGKIPDSVEVISSRANLERRQAGLDTAIEFLKSQLDNPTMDIYVKAAIITEWASMLAKNKGSAEEARAVFTKNAQWYVHSRHFWQKWLQFELEQPTSAETEAQHHERLKRLVTDMLTKSGISVAAKKELGQQYLNYLQQRGGVEAMAEFLAVDRKLFG